MTVGDTTTVDPTKLKIWLTNNTVSAGCCDYGSNSVKVLAETTVDFALDIDMASSANTSVTLIYDVHNLSGCAVDFPNQNDTGSFTTPEIHDCTPYCTNATGAVIPCPQ